MILGTQINWQVCLYTLKAIDAKLIRDADASNKALDYSAFIELFNQAFPGCDARDHIFSSCALEIVSSDSALTISVLFDKHAIGGDIICLTGNLNTWIKAICTILSSDFSTRFSTRDYKIINSQFAEKYAMLTKLDKNLFKHKHMSTDARGTVWLS